MAQARLAGIARRDRSRGDIETLDSVSVTVEAGLAGDFRGSLKPGRNKRQISLIEAESWATAIAEAGIDEPWWKRRANLLVEGVRLPRREGAIIAIGPDLRIEVTMECDPCSRMEELAPGLMTALAPDWRGGVLGRVLSAGDIKIGDDIRIEE